MKHCNTCVTTKSENDFHKRKASLDGLAARCKSCQSIYDKARANKPDRVAARLAYSETERGREARERARSKWLIHNRHKRTDICNAWDKRNPSKSRACKLVAWAVKKGDLIKGPCEVCSSPDVHGHHDDYAKPYDVRWLCSTHHREWHKVNGEGKNPNADLSEYGRKKNISTKKIEEMV